MIETLYAEHFELLYHYAYTVLHDRPSAENLVNDTFLDAIKKAELLLTHENPTGWLMQALKFHIRHYLTAQAKQPTILPLDSVQEPPSQESELKDAEESLSEEDRRFYELYYKHGLSHKELSKRFGISVSASQKRLERIREKLKQYLFEP